MRLLKRRKQQREAQRIKHEQEQDERINRIETEVRALSAYVKKQPNLKAI